VVVKKKTYPPFGNLIVFLVGTKKEFLKYFKQLPLGKFNPQLLMFNWMGAML
jgi:hypothetical protein